MNSVNQANDTIRRLGKVQRAQLTSAMLGTLRFAQPTVTDHV